MRIHLRIGSFTLSPSSRRSAYSVMDPDGKPSVYTME
jgi:hypothetical protein